MAERTTTEPLPSIVVTGDGSKTLYCPTYRQTYHSRHGALTESQHVFIDSTGVRESFRSGNQVTILEIGFGTGLNFLLSAGLAEEFDTGLRYVALERRLLPANLLRSLDYGTLLSCHNLTDALLDHIEDSRRNDADCGYTFSYKNIKLWIIPKLDYYPEGNNRPVDFVFLDAFSPEQNPELWSNNLITRFHSCLKSGGKLATYCAKGDVRRSLIAAGFAVQRLPGPPGKREILVGTK